MNDNFRERYWLYVVFNCGTVSLRPYRIRDPFGKLVADAKGGVVIRFQSVLAGTLQNGGA